MRDGENYDGTNDDNYVAIALSPMARETLEYKCVIELQGIHHLTVCQATTNKVKHIQNEIDCKCKNAAGIDVWTDFGR
jgi:hypothetical protein